MPKKFGVNDKAAVARERKETVKKEENARKQKEKEDKLWEETDPKILKQQARKQEEEKKKQEQLKRQAEKKALEEKERQELAKKYAKPTDTKVTRAMIEEQRRLEREQQEREKKKKEKEDEQEIPIEENINHIIRNQQLQHEEDGLHVVEARSVEEAVEKLSLDGDVDRHPEKRMKAAYLAYEANNLPILKQENPGLKLSQLKELLWKQWQKAPENPLNQQQ